MGGAIAGLVLLLLFYLATGIVLNHYTGQLSKARIAEFALVAVVVLSMILWWRL